MAYAHILQGRCGSELFAGITSGSQNTALHDPLDQYLESPPRLTAKDPLVYWSSALECGSEHPDLACMALDYLSVLGMCYAITSLYYCLIHT